MNGRERNFSGIVVFGFASTGDCLYFIFLFLLRMDMEFDCEHRFLQAGIHSTPGSSHTDPWTLNIRLWTGGTE